MAESPEPLTASIREIANSLAEAYESLEAEVVRLEDELSAVRGQRNRLKAAVRQLDPNRFPPEKKNGTPQRKGASFGRKSYDYVLEFARQYTVGEFGSRDLLQHPNYKGPRESTLPSILRALHTDGLIRLARRGKGYSRYYEVIR